MYFFKHAPHTDLEELEKIIGSDIVIREAYDVLNQLSWTEAEINTYEREKKSQLDGQAMLAYATRVGREEGEAKGLAKGLAEGKAEVAKKMIANGMSIQTIALYTGLSIEQIA